VFLFNSRFKTAAASHRSTLWPADARRELSRPPTTSTGPRRSSWRLGGASFSNPFSLSRRNRSALTAGAGAAVDRLCVRHALPRCCCWYAHPTPNKSTVLSYFFDLNTRYPRALPRGASCSVTAAPHRGERGCVPVLPGCRRRAAGAPQAGRLPPAPPPRRLVPRCSALTTDTAGA
jgi:hypothetical protein